MSTTAHDRTTVILRHGGKMQIFNISCLKSLKNFKTNLVANLKLLISADVFSQSVDKNDSYLFINRCALISLN